MNKIKLTLLFFLFSALGFSQEQPVIEKGKKGDFYFYWGWNRASHTKSDIHFTGNNYDFTLNDVIAKDRQSSWDPAIYLNPAHMTIPQYNFRIGYFINNKYNISIGIDHMKYVMQNNQTVKIDGEINNTGTIYDGSYSNDDIILTADFLLFEHTDGLNYVNTEIRRFDNIFDFNKVKINLTEGAGIGALYPKTNATLMQNLRYDEFHLAGYGLNAVVGLNIEFFNYFFIQSELKGGFIHMPDIRTTSSKNDKASQHFFFSQINIVFGANISFNKNTNK